MEQVEWQMVAHSICHMASPEKKKKNWQIISFIDPNNCQGIITKNEWNTILEEKKGVFEA